MSCLELYWSRCSDLQVALLDHVWKEIVATRAPVGANKGCKLHPFSQLLRPYHVPRPLWMWDWMWTLSRRGMYIVQPMQYEGGSKMQSEGLQIFKNFTSAGGEVWWHLKVWVAERPPVPTCGPPLLLIARINHIRASLRSTDSTAMQQFSSVQQHQSEIY